MGARGPKPKPSALKKKQGTYKKCNQAPDEYSPELAHQLPKPPLYFNKYAKAEYYSIGPILQQDGLLATIDISLFISYCQNMGIYMESQAILKKEGRVSKAKSGYLMPHPMVAIGNSAYALAIKVSASFGISPSARTRVSAEKKEKEKPKGGILSLITTKGSAKNG